MRQYIRKPYSWFLSSLIVLNLLMLATYYVISIDITQGVGSGIRSTFEIALIPSCFLFFWFVIYFFADFFVTNRFFFGLSLFHYASSVLIFIHLFYLSSVLAEIGELDSKYKLYEHFAQAEFGLFLLIQAVIIVFLFVQLIKTLINKIQRAEKSN